jgi:hypothetical protein
LVHRQVAVRKGLGFDALQMNREQRVYIQLINVIN